MEIRKSKFISVPPQAERLTERRSAERFIKRFRGDELLVFPGVYGTSVDTELMIDTVAISPDETFLEVGVGTGAVSIAIAKKAKSGLGVDINAIAVENSIENARLAKISNVRFVRSNGFQSVQERFDVIICNPPYGNQMVRDDTDRMFWDPADELKIHFFKEVNAHLNPNGRIYFGWADFADIDVHLPIRLAEENGFQIVNTVARDSRNHEFQFLVFEIKRQ